MTPEYQGRVFTLMASVATAMTLVGLLLATPVADLTGVRTWYLGRRDGLHDPGRHLFLVRPIVEMEGAGESMSRRVVESSSEAMRL